MRTKAEIEKAIRYLRRAVASHAGNHETNQVAFGLALINSLEWAMGEESDFTALLSEMESAEKAMGN